jgi:hypothetical protein
MASSGPSLVGPPVEVDPGSTPAAYLVKGEQLGCLSDAVRRQLG